MLGGPSAGHLHEVEADALGHLGVDGGGAGIVQVVREHADEVGFGAGWK